MTNDQLFAQMNQLNAQMTSISDKIDAAADVMITGLAHAREPGAIGWVKHQGWSVVDFHKEHTLLAIAIDAAVVFSAITVGTLVYNKVYGDEVTVMDSLPEGKLYSVV